MTYQAPSLVRAVGLRLARRAMRERDPMADEPQRTFLRPRAMARLLGGHGFTVTADRDLLTIARQAGAETAPMGASPRAGRVAVARRDQESAETPTPMGQDTPVPPSPQ